jgi:hypothetical protein
MRTKNKNALEVVDQMIGDDRELRWKVAEAGVNGDIAQIVYDLRVARGLSRDEFAQLTHTTASTVEDLEEADYEGDSLQMLSRIAFELGLRVEVGLVPTEMPAWKQLEAEQTVAT